MMSNHPLISPSHVARQALKMARAVGPKAKHEMTCITCGFPIHVGEPAIKWTPTKGTFTDWTRLAGTARHTIDASVICSDCAPLLGNDALRYTQRAVITTNRIYSLTKDQHRVWLLRTPPTPPYVVVVADSMKQHLVWPAAVTYDNRMLMIQLGKTPLTVDRELTLEAEKWCARAAQIGRNAQIRVTPQHPFSSLNRERKGGDHGVIRSDFMRLAQENAEMATLIDRLQQLGEGELWALAHLAKAKKEEAKADLVAL